MKTVVMSTPIQDSFMRKTQKLSSNDTE